MLATWALIDRVIYINMDRRVDRRTETEAELERLGVPKEKIERFSAIEKAPAFLGCSLSHLSVVEKARERKLQNVLILEDDFDFHPDANLVHSRLQEFMKIYGETYNLSLLASNTFKSEPCSEIVDYIRDAQTCAGYLISGRFFDALIDCWKNAYVQLERTGNHGLYMCDMSWKQLQTGPTYVFRPRLGYQRISKSDLGQSINDYTWQLQCPMENDAMADLSAATVASKDHKLPGRLDVYSAIQQARLKGQFRQVVRLYEAYDWSKYTGEGYNFGLWDEVVISAYYVQKINLGKQAAQELLVRMPIQVYWQQIPRLQDNFKFYLDNSLNQQLMERVNDATLVSAETMGGLGNQLFQVATAMALSYDHSCRVVFEKITESASVFKPRPVYWDTLLHKVPTVHSTEYRKLSFETYTEPQRLFKPIPMQKGRALRLTGYYQTAKYFDRYREKIQELFQLPSQDTVDTLWKALPEAKNRVSLHVRRGDYTLLAHTLVTLPLLYYQRAVKHYPETTQFLIFSDDLPWCQQNFTWLPNHVFMPASSDVNEMMVMSRCDGHILANSTFSWWAAYLDPKPGTVVAPKEWFNPATQIDWSEIYLPGWKIESGL